MTTPWSKLGNNFLSEGDWAIGQGVGAPDRQLLRHLLRSYKTQAAGLPIRLLEVGSGPGIEIEGLAQDGLLGDVSYVGYDFTPELVAGCRERHPDSRFEIVDVQTMQDKEVADIVWCRHLLEHVEDWEQALRNVIRASRVLTIISWFIRPTWKTSDVNTGVVEGFIHHTVDAKHTIGIVRDCGADLYRFDLDYHLIRGSVWLISADPSCESLAIAAHRFMTSKPFLQAMLPVPEHPRTVELRESVDELRDYLIAWRESLSVK